MCRCGFDLLWFGRRWNRSSPKPAPKPKSKPKTKSHRSRRPPPNPPSHHSSNPPSPAPTTSPPSPTSTPPSSPPRPKLQLQKRTDPYFPRPLLGHQSHDTTNISQAQLDAVARPSFSLHRPAAGEIYGGAVEQGYVLGPVVEDLGMLGGGSRLNGPPDLGDNMGMHRLRSYEDPGYIVASGGLGMGQYDYYQPGPSMGVPSQEQFLTQRQHGMGEIFLQPGMGGSVVGFGQQRPLQAREGMMGDLQRGGNVQHGLRGGGVVGFGQQRPLQSREEGDGGVVVRGGRLTDAEHARRRRSELDRTQRITDLGLSPGGRLLGQQRLEIQGGERETEGGGGAGALTVRGDGEQAGRKSGGLGFRDGL